MNFQAQLVEHRTYLLCYPQLQLRNHAWAENAVSETLLAASSKLQSFGDRSQLMTWLVGILKNKVIDFIRCHTREVSQSDSDLNNESDTLDQLVLKPTAFLPRSPRRGASRTKICSSINFLLFWTLAGSVCRLRRAGIF